jgi:hypothetical protein
VRVLAGAVPIWPTLGRDRPVPVEKPGPFACRAI